MNAAEVPNPTRILVVGPSWVGDMVMAQTLFMNLKQQNPATEIDVLAPAWSQPLLKRMPQVRKPLELPIGHGPLALGVRRKLGHGLRDQGYDQAIVLPNSFKSALIPWFAKIPKRTGWKGEMRYGVLNDVRVLDKEAYPLMIERFVALAYPASASLPVPLPRPQLSINPTKVEKSLRKFFLRSDRPVLALCPGAEFGEAKRWPTHHYATVAQHKINEGWQVWLFGSANDHKVAEQIRAKLAEQAQQYCVNLAGKTTLADAVDLMSLAKAVVTNDSGLMHIAAALGRPLVAVYGSSSDQFTPPLSDRAKTLRTDIDCSPCFQRECPLGHLKCLKELPAEWALNALDELAL